MGRILKELKYSVGMKRHIFFLVLICFVVCGASWLFQDTLRDELEKAFPGTYSSKISNTELNTYQIQGTVSQKSPQVSNADLKAEIKFNSLLRKAQWMSSYEEIAQEYIQIASFQGPDSAVKGYGEDSFYDNKDIDISGTKYTTINTVWMEQSLAEKYNLGAEAVQMYYMPNDYLKKVYVVLGAKYNTEDGYRVGNILKAKNEIGTFQMQIIGFLKPGATAMIGGKEVNLDSTIVCPFIPLDDVYLVKEEVVQSYTDGVYIPAKLVDTSVGDFYRNNPPNKKNDKTGLQYAEVNALYIERSAVTEDSPAWLKALANVGENEDFTRIVVGSNYGVSQKIIPGTPFEMLNGSSHVKLQAIETLEAGATWTVYGMDVVLDNYIIFLQPEEKKEETVPDPNTPDEEPDDGDIYLDDEPIGEKEREFKVEERGKLFHYQVMMNKGYLTSTLTADEAQKNLESMTAEAWSDFYRDNPKDKALTTYRMEGADQENSILFRGNAMDLVKKVKNFTKYGFPICMLLFGVFLLYKLRKGKDYYAAIYMTGTTRVEIMLLYVVEGALMVALATACAVAFAFVISKLLQLDMSPWKPLLKRNIRLVGFPTAIALVFILLIDYGRRFRRKKEV